jgi:hypothetical protein
MLYQGVDPVTTDLLLLSLLFEQSSGCETMLQHHLDAPTSWCQQVLQHIQPEMTLSAKSCTLRCQRHFICMMATQQRQEQQQWSVHEHLDQGPAGPAAVYAVSWASQRSSCQQRDSWFYVLFCAAQWLAVRRRVL